MFKTLIITILTLFVGQVIAQEAAPMLHTTYYYTVENVLSTEQLDEVVDEIEQLEFVTKVKVNYKPEKNTKAQFVVIVDEPKRVSETQDMFELTDLKSIIINNELLPSDLEIVNN